MALFSPGVEVNVIDESFYTPSAAGTVPMIFVASKENKTNSSGSGVAEGTLKANAGRPYLLTSQRELGELFGDPVFMSDGNGNMIHGGELNEYGLQTAYSLLGVTNRVFVTRADIDISKLEASATPPGGDPADGTYWFDTDSTAFGIAEWNGAPITTVGGQTFTTKAPIVLTPSDVARTSGESLTAPGAPKKSVGQIGDYAVVAITNLNKLYYKSPGYGASIAVKEANIGEWVEVGSLDWKGSWPTLRSEIASTTTFDPSNSFTIDGQDITRIGNTATALAEEINNEGISGVSANVVDGELEIYTTNDSLTLAGSAMSEFGFTAGTYYSPALQISTHTNVPAFKTGDTESRPTGSIWYKTTEPNAGMKYSIRQYNEDTQLWETIPAPVYNTSASAIYELDRTGGGENLQIGDIYTKANNEEASDPNVANFKFYRRQVNGRTLASSEKVTGTTLGAGTYKVAISETKVNSDVFTTPRVATITITNAASSAVADDVAAGINGAGLTNVTAEIDAQNRILLGHATGGDAIIYDIDGLLADLGYTAFEADDPSTTANFYAAPAQIEADAVTTVSAVDPAVAAVDGAYMISNWRPLEYTPSPDAPTSLTADGELWYSSIIDEVDIMVHDGPTNGWQGYQNVYPDTSPAGPIVSATEPEQQSDGSALVDGDLWIDTSDLENYPNIYRFNVALQLWTLIDKTDQTSENGILFDEARWGLAGSDSDAADIVDLLSSNYLDPDAPDPALYPRGMLLWNLRRSGFNVKRFVRNHINIADDNIRNNDESMINYYPHRWVTDSGNNEDGSGTFGRFAQRKSVVQKLQAMVNGNIDIRDEELIRFNLMATPGYPELIGEMIDLNYTRRLTGMVIGDTPLRLTPDATSLNEWASNANLATEDNDFGGPSRDEYLAMYYPAGFTSDNFGNNIVVPPTHMALRTIILSDQKSYPWFAPAGVRRGGVTNSTSTGYINDEGEFYSIALGSGVRDTLYENNINPITFIAGAGIQVFGQKTRARAATALDRINVVRLVIYMRTTLEALARPYLFEPNDKITRDQIKQATEGFLLELASLRALYDYVVVCDESNNTPARIDRNELWIDVAIEPVKAVEFIYIPLRIKNTGEIAALGS